MSEANRKATITLISQLTKQVHRRTSEELLGMPWRQFIALSALVDRASMSQQSLCESIVMDPNNCVLLLNELEALGYVARSRDPTDRRRHIVAIADPGREAYDRAQTARATVEDEVLAALDPGERRALHDLLVKALEGERHEPERREPERREPERREPERREPEPEA